MNLIYLGVYIIFAGLLVMSSGIVRELNKKFEPGEDLNVVTVEKGVSLERYTLKNSFFDDRGGPVYVVGLSYDLPTPPADEGKGEGR